MPNQNPNVLTIAMNLNGQNIPVRREKPFILYVAVFACFLTYLFSLESEFMLSMLLSMSAFAMTFL